MPRLLSVALVLLVVSSCSAGLARVVHPGDTTRVGAHEGALIVASEQAPRVDLTLCVDGDRGRCAEVGPTLPDGGLEVYLLPAGRYCVVHVRCEEAPGVLSEHDVPDDEVRCIEIAAGGVVYPGHVVFDRSVASGRVCAGRADWLPHDSIDADLRAAYPALGARVTLATPVAMTRP